MHSTSWRVFPILYLASMAGAAASAGTLTIPLTVNQELRYVVGVNMSYSPSTQKFNFVMALNTGYSAVAGASCTDCNGVPSYNSSESTSEQPLNETSSVSFGEASVSGSLIKEDCGLQQNNGSVWLYTNQTILVANSSSSLFSNLTSGLFGLGSFANGQTGNFADTVFGQFFERNPDQNNFTFGMDLKAPKFTSEDDTGNGGELHWLVPDSKAYDASQVTFMTASVSSSAANNGSDNSTSGTTANSNSSANSQFVLPESDWAIEIDGWTVTTSGTSNGAANGNKSEAIIEPFFQNIYFPQSAADLFYAATPSASVLDNLVSGAVGWTLPCDTEISLAFSFNGTAFAIDESLLVQQQSDGSCIGTVQAWPDASVTSFMIGSNFISAYYLIYVIGAQGSGVPNMVGWANRSESKSTSKTDVGAIVGGTVGGFAFAAIACFVAFVLWRRKNRMRLSATTSSTEIGSGRYPSSPLPAKEKFNYGTDHGASYVVNALPHGGQFTTPPPSGRSTVGFLPEAHTPQEPSFTAVSLLNGTGAGSHPPSPNSATDFLVLSPASGSGFGAQHRQEGSAFSVGSRISYNSQALAANRPSSTQAGSSSPSTSPVSLSQFPVAVSGLGQPSCEAKIEPFVMPTPVGGFQGLTPPPSRGSEKFRILHPSQTEPTSNQEPSSPGDIDPFSPSSISTGATAHPFIIPESGVKEITEESRDKKVARGPTAVPMRVAHPPAPPYSAQATAPVSPTLVEEGPDNSPGYVM